MSRRNWLATKIKAWKKEKRILFNITIRFTSLKEGLYEFIRKAIGQICG